MVARSNEDGEEAFTCVNVEKPRSSGNSKKSNSNRLTSDDEAIYSAVCRAEKHMSICSCLLHRLLCFSAKESHFLFDGAIYDQVDGVAVGSRWDLYLLTSICVN